MVSAAFVEGDRPELLLLVHHLVMDGVSWRILLPDLESAYTAIHAGREPRLRPVPTSLRRWTAALPALAEAKRAELPYWSSIAAVTKVPRPVPGRDTFGATRSLIRTLPDAEPLLGEVPDRLRARVDDVLLTALGLALGAHFSEADPVVELEGHGRQQDLVPGADLSRTIGWFTTAYPVRLPAAGVTLDEAERDPAAAARAVAAVRESLGAVPDRGIGYGLLRDLTPQAPLAGSPRPGIAFNYLGRLGGSPSEQDDWRPIGGLGGTYDDERTAEHTLTVDVTALGSDLRATWAYAGQVFAEADVDRLADLWFRALRALAQADPGARRLTVGDVSLAGLNESRLAKLQARWANR